VKDHLLSALREDFREAGPLRWISAILHEALKFRS
jgi:hypothetical protein